MSLLIVPYSNQKGGKLGIFQRTSCHPLSAKGEERVDKRSVVGVSKTGWWVKVGI
jgi:hypothetical protein